MIIHTHLNSAKLMRNLKIMRMISSMTVKETNCRCLNCHANWHTANIASRLVGLSPVKKLSIK